VVSVPASKPCGACEAQARQERRAQQDHEAGLIRVRKRTRSVRAASGGCLRWEKGTDKVSQITSE
jgi:hypothetical protein